MNKFIMVKIFMLAGKFAIVPESLYVPSSSLFGHNICATKDY
jgi:hypothetical protein